MEATEPWVPAFAGGSLGKLIDLARDALKNVLRPAEVELSLEERQLRDMFKRVAGEVGDRLLDAEDVEIYIIGSARRWSPTSCTNWGRRPCGRPPSMS